MLHSLETDNEDWFGGTRIGACLHAFILQYASRMLDSKTVVMIISDGWDRGDMDLLRQSMAFLHNNAKKVIWLNPLAGYAAYRPEVAGMQTAMPYIDVLAPVHNAESLKKLVNLF
jgi:uncharacterized protein with von Willebrand factor type A (vWA) domain